MEKNYNFYKIDIKNFNFLINTLKNNNSCSKNKIILFFNIVIIFKEFFNCIKNCNKYALNNKNFVFKILLIY